MIKQKTIVIKTSGATLTYAEMGDIIVNSSSALQITLPTPASGLWYRISNVNTGIVTVYYGSALTTLKQTEQCLCLANGTSAWFFSKGGGAMTKPEIEAVLTGQISTHSHAPVYELPLGGNIGQALKKKSATDRDVEWGDVAGGTSFADVATGTGIITTTGWEANTGDYDLKLVLTVSGITADDKVFVTPDPDDIDIAIEAELCTSVDSGVDTLTFYCKTTPTATIGFSYIKFQGATNVLPSGGTAGQVLSKVDEVDYNVGWEDAPSGSPLTTKGDVHVFGASDARLPVGTDGQVLTADSEATLGMKWATPSGGGGGSTNEALVLNTATLICTLKSRTYTKVNEGWALAAYIGTTSSGPLLISTVADNVTYIASSGGPFTYAGTLIYNGVTYYYSATEHFWGGDYSDTSGTGRAKMFFNNYEMARKELLDRYFRNGF